MLYIFLVYWWHNSSRIYNFCLVHWLTILHLGWYFRRCLRNSCLSTWKKNVVTLAVLVSTFPPLSLAYGHGGTGYLENLPHSSRLCWSQSNSGLQMVKSANHPSTKHSVILHAVSFMVWPNNSLWEIPKVKAPIAKLATNHICKMCPFLQEAKELCYC